MMRFGGNFYYPFRSREVCDICEHLTPEENRRLRSQAMRSGLIMGSIFGGLFGLLQFWILIRSINVMSAYLPLVYSCLVLFSLVIPLGLLIGLIAGIPVRKRTARTLSETEYARQMGYTSETLALYRPSLKPFVAALIAIPLLVAGVVVAAWWTTHTNEAHARMIVARMARAYANCQSYRDTGVVESRYVEKTGRRTVEQPFSTAFVRPDHFRFEYSSNEGGQKPYRYIICSQPKDSPTWWDWIWSNTNDVQTWWDVQPGIKTSKSLGFALGGATGVSGGSAPTTAALLLPGEVWGSLTGLADLRLAADGKLGDVECFRIEGKYGNLPTTLWIEKETYLLRRRDQLMTLTDFSVEQTTTYEPVIDGQVGDELLAFNPPVQP